MEKLNEQLLKLAEVGGYEWKDRIAELKQERKQAILSLIGQRQASTSNRVFKYELPSEKCKGFYVDTVVVTLLDNGTCLLFWDQGNIDHNSNDHRIGVFTETTDSVKITNISTWRDDAANEEYAFVKKSENSLFFNDNRNSAHVKEKNLVLINLKSK